MPSCAQCFYFDAYPSGKAGVCRVLPPQPGRGSALSAAWPVVTVSDWCGQHTARIAVPVAPTDGA